METIAHTANVLMAVNCMPKMANMIKDTFSMFQHDSKETNMDLAILCAMNVYPQISCVELGCSSVGSVLAQPVQSPQLELYHTKLNMWVFSWCP